MLCIPIHQFYLNFLRLAILDDVLDNKEVVVVALREGERERVAATFFNLHDSRAQNNCVFFRIMIKFYNSYMYIRCNRI